MKVTSCSCPFHIALKKFADVFRCEILRCYSHAAQYCCNIQKWNALLYQCCINIIIRIPQEYRRKYILLYIIFCFINIYRVYCYIRCIFTYSISICKRRLKFLLLILTSIFLLFAAPEKFSDRIHKSSVRPVATHEADDSFYHNT